MSEKQLESSMFYVRELTTVSISRLKGHRACQHVKELFLQQCLALRKNILFDIANDPL